MKNTRADREKRLTLRSAQTQARMRRILSRAIQMKEMMSRAIQMSTEFYIEE